MTILVDFTTILASAKTIKGATWHQIDQFSMGFKQSPKNSNKLKHGFDLIQLQGKVIVSNFTLNLLFNTFF